MGHERCPPADDHGADDGRPAGVEHLVRVLVAMRDDPPQRNHRHHEDQQQRRQPIVAVCADIT